MLRAHCATWPTAIRKRSPLNASEPINTMPSSSTAEIHAAASRLVGTLTPSTTSGNASTFKTSSVPNTITEPAAMPDAARSGGTPSPTSISYCSTADVAAPPGTRSLTALPARYECKNGAQRCSWVAIRCTAHMQMRLALSVAAITANQPGWMSPRRGQAPSTSPSFGASPYSASPATGTASTRFTIAPRVMCWCLLRACASAHGHCFFQADPPPNAEASTRSGPPRPRRTEPRRGTRADRGNTAEVPHRRRSTRLPRAMRSARVVLAMIRSRDRFNTIRSGGEPREASRAPRNRVPWARLIRRDIPCGRVPSIEAPAPTSLTEAGHTLAILAGAARALAVGQLEPS